MVVQRAVSGIINGGKQACWRASRLVDVAAVSDVACREHGEECALRRAHGGMAGRCRWLFLVPLGCAHPPPLPCRRHLAAEVKWRDVTGTEVAFGASLGLDVCYRLDLIDVALLNVSDKHS